VFACGSGDDVFVTHRVSAYRKAGGIYSMLYYLKDSVAHKNGMPRSEEIVKATMWPRR